MGLHTALFGLPLLVLAYPLEKKENRHALAAPHRRIHLLFSFAKEASASSPFLSFQKPSTTLLIVPSFCTNGRERMRHGMGKTLEHGVSETCALHEGMPPTTEWRENGSSSLEKKKNKTVGRNEIFFLLY